MSEQGRAKELARPFIMDPLERKRRGLPLLWGSEWRVGWSDEQLAAWADREMERIAFKASLTPRNIDDDRELFLNRKFERYFSAPDFEPKKSTARAARFADASEGWDLP